MICNVLSTSHQYFKKSCLQLLAEDADTCGDTRLQLRYTLHINSKLN